MRFPQIKLIFGQDPLVDYDINKTKKYYTKTITKS